MGNKAGKLKGKDKKAVEDDEEKAKTAENAENAEGATEEKADDQANTAENAEDKAKTGNGEAVVTAEEAPAEKAVEPTGEAAESQEPKQPAESKTDANDTEANETGIAAKTETDKQSAEIDKQSVESDKTETPLETETINEQQAQDTKTSDTNADVTEVAEAKDTVTTENITEPTKESPDSVQDTNADVDAKEIVNEPSESDKGTLIETPETKSDPEPKVEVADDNVEKQPEIVKEGTTEVPLVEAKTTIIVTTTDDDEKETTVTKEPAESIETTSTEKQADSSKNMVEKTEEESNEEPKVEVTKATDKEEGETKQDGTKVATEFRWEGEGDSVLVSGSFNDWGDKVPLQKTDTVFLVSVDLLPGEYTYKYFVDDQWQVNKNQPLKADDSGAENNVINVTCG